jgi:hypothetical protein
MKLERQKRKRKQVYKCYEKEIEKYKHLYFTEVSHNEVRKLIKILQKKFKVHVKEINFDKTSEWYGGRAHLDGSIDFYTNHHLNILLVCHEFAHLYCFKQKIYYHPWKFYQNLAKVIDYLEKTISLKITLA